jgi:PhnB protein
MTKLNSYLNFPGNTEEAFNFYKSVFGGEFVGGLMRFKDVADLPGKENLNAADLNKIMHVALNIGDNMLMATDVLESMGQHLTTGTNFSLSLHPDSKKEADRLYNELSAGGQPTMPMMDMFWGDYWGALTDKFGIQWMVNYSSNQKK